MHIHHTLCHIFFLYTYSHMNTHIYSHNAHREIDRYLMAYAQSTAKGHITAKQNAFLSQVKILIHNLIHIPLLRIGETWVK